MLHSVISYSIVNFVTKYKSIKVLGYEEMKYIYLTEITMRPVKVHCSVDQYKTLASLRNKRP